MQHTQITMGTQMKRFRFPEMNLNSVVSCIHHRFSLHTAIWLCYRKIAIELDQTTRARISDLIDIYYVWT